MPKPNPKSENQRQFVSRCIPTVLKEGTAKDNKQAAAICYSMWKNRNKHKKSRAEEIMESLAKEVNAQQNKEEKNKP